MALAKAEGAKRALRLPVSAAFHSSLMTPVVAGLRPLIEAVPLSPPTVPLVGNVDARPLREPDELRQELLDQITAPVRWVDVVATLAAAGVTTYHEVGPGNVLAGLIARCQRAATVVTAESLLAAS
jgi:[acyl-carrier-protein] S-malonyltransferase